MGSNKLTREDATQDFHAMLVQMGGLDIGNSIEWQVATIAEGELKGLHFIVLKDGDSGKEAWSEILFDNENNALQYGAILETALEVLLNIVGYDIFKTSAN